MGWDPVTRLHEALGADLLRCALLKAPRPSVANRYIIEGLLGRGASGVVVSARDVKLERTVALKLRVGGSDRELLEEARALARLEHPNVVHVYDVDFVEAVLDGTTFRLWLVSMQFVAGRSLRGWLEEGQRRPEEIVRIFIQAGRGLAAAHDRKIVHRDFKPDNVMVSDDGCAMVLDFGFAVAAASSRSTEGGPKLGVAGTGPYMAPEARLGHPGRRSDQFSFGVSLLEALPGEAAVGDQCPPEYSLQFWAVVARATAQNAAERFEDMHALLAALEAVQGSVSPEAVGVSLGTGSEPSIPRGSHETLGPSGAKRSRTRWLALAGAILATVSLVVVTFALSPSVRRAAPEPGTVWGRGVGRNGGSAGRGTTRGVVTGDRASDGGTHGRSDASLESEGGRADLPVAPTSVDVTGKVASVDVATSGAERRSCARASGTYVFRTIRRRGGRPGDAESACYELVLDENRRGLTASLARSRPRVDHLEVTLVRREPNCAIWLEASAESRRYGFRFRVEGGSITGGFKATADPARPDFSGDVESLRP